MNDHETLSPRGSAVDLGAADAATAAMQATKATKAGFIYFIGLAEDENRGGMVKIGWSKFPERRLTDLQTARHERLAVWATVPGTRLHEKELHRLLDIEREHPRAEWFRMSLTIVLLLELFGHAPFRLKPADRKAAPRMLKPFWKFLVGLGLEMDQESCCDLWSRCGIT